MSEQPSEKAERAKELNRQGLEALRNRDWSEAEDLFSAALAIDVNYGPAHNNLGQIYLQRHQLYLAAWEFEFAANLMPARNESHVNLGLVYETAGQLENALDHYQIAHQIQPTDPQALGNLARVSVKLDRDPARVHWLLNELIMHDNRRHWVHWAKDLLATRYRMPVQLAAAETPGPTAEDVYPETPEGIPDTDELPVPVPAGEPGSLMLEATPLELSQSREGGLRSTLHFPSDLPRIPNMTDSADLPAVIPASFSTTQ